MRCLSTGAEISAPLEDLPNPITWRSGSGTPIDETAHALVCQAKGERVFNRIPDWFHEGTAEIFRNESQSRIFRAMNRIRVWLAQRTNLPTPGQMCLGDAGDSGEERNWFYLTSEEFTRTLEAQEGPGSLVTDGADLRRFARVVQCPLAAQKKDPAGPINGKSGNGPKRDPAVYLLPAGLQSLMTTKPS